MEDKGRLSVVIDGRVYLLAGGSESHLQKIASYVDAKIRELKKQPGYSKLSMEYRDILLALNIAEDLFKSRDELEVFHQEHQANEEELYQLKQEIVDKEMQINTSNRLITEYKAKVNELQKRIIELETKNELH